MVSYCLEAGFWSSPPRCHCLQSSGHSIPFSQSLWVNGSCSHWPWMEFSSILQIKVSTRWHSYNQQGYGCSHYFQLEPKTLHGSHKYLYAYLQHYLPLRHHPHHCSITRVLSHFIRLHLNPPPFNHHFQLRLNTKEQPRGKSKLTSPIFQPVSKTASLYHLPSPTAADLCQATIKTPTYEFAILYEHRNVHRNTLRALPIKPIKVRFIHCG